MGRQVHITMEMDKFRKEFKSLFNDKYPKSVALGFRAVAKQGRDDMRVQTRRAFDLHSDYIPRGILSTPIRNTQIKAAVRSIRRYHDIEASVFVRPASSPKKSLGFLVNHEFGGIKRGQGGSVAVPAGGISKYKSKTPRGATAKRWKPATLLKNFNTKGANVKGHKIHSRKKGRGKSDAFVIKGKNGVWMVVRRTSPKRKPLEFLYSFKKTVTIKPVLAMEETVTGSVRAHYARIMRRHMSRHMR